MAQTDSAPDHVHTREYYQYVFPDLYPVAEPEIDRASVDERVAIHRAYWRAAGRAGKRFEGETAWNLLHRYLDILDRRMKAIAERHSHYYWVHLYRRIGVGLHPKLPSKRDPVTKYLVRNIMEVCFVRHALAGGQDIRPSSAVELGEIMNGLYLAALRRVHEDSFICDLGQVLKAKPQWVMIDFGRCDLVEIYRLEALAYEYWLVTARMRRVGKGGAIKISSLGDCETAATSDEFEGLLVSYDARHDSGALFASAIGVSFSTQARGALAALFPYYNIDGVPWGKSCPYANLVSGNENLVTNFVYAGFSLVAFAEAHSFAESAFRKARGFSLKSFSGYLCAIVLEAFGSALDPDAPEEKRFLALHHLYQRAYIVQPYEGYSAMLTDTAVELMDHWLGAESHTMAADAPRIHEFLTFEEGKRPGALWSRGPRFAFFRHGPAILVDLEGLIVQIRNAFFRVPYDQGKKGPLFEDVVRLYLRNNGLDVLPDRMLKHEEEVREADLLVRVGTTLFVGECRAMERPLDYEIGRVRTMTARISDFDEKVTQALSLADFVRQRPVGRNYDLRWAEEVVPLVISPFVEWVWARDERLWIAPNVPRILSVTEARDMMKNSARRRAQQLVAPNFLP